MNVEGAFSIFYLPAVHKFLYCDRPDSAYLYYSDFRLNLLTGRKEKRSIEEFLRKLEKDKLLDLQDKPEVTHFFYDFGLVLSGHDELVSSNTPLAIQIQYGQHRIWEQLPFEDLGPLEITPVEFPLFDKYNEKFETIYKHLMDGDCYQVNLTEPFYFQFSRDFSFQEFIGRLFRDKMSISAFAHCTYIHSLDKLFLSNSPECLFKISKKNDQVIIRSMPIKGTMSFKGREWKKTWYELKNSKKNESELFMIADLLRNDLTRIQLSPAKIVAKKLPLVVPGLVHQYSVIESEIESDVSVLDMMSAIFPGGSITGAPKMRVMEIIQKVEKRARGFYCGSTMIRHRSMIGASINIRSAEIDFSSKELVYGAGGGITLDSSASEEFDEMYAKQISFLHLLSGLES